MYCRCPIEEHVRLRKQRIAGTRSLPCWSTVWRVGGSDHFAMNPWRSNFCPRVFRHHFGNRLPNFHVLIPVCHHHTSASHLQNFELTNRLFKNRIERQGRRIAKIPAKTIRPGTWEKSNNDPYQLPPKIAWDGSNCDLTRAGI